ncbi:7980_t:CDS:2 [Funneliformis mosseae]|uniref:7980_t:CDS:1 n=1 Tax=Funneliformis mosseae TaxID=27381 RepID=A0A9N8ZY88_FUNMO|nr:7980_t:CDS:2 [Funneliformis mosseae]
MVREIPADLALWKGSEKGEEPLYDPNSLEVMRSISEIPLKK